MQKDWWIPILQWTLPGVALTIIMGWLAKSRMSQRPVTEVNTLRHPTGILVIGLIGFAFFAGIAVVSNTIGKNSTTTIWTTLIFLFFAGMSLAMVADYFFARHHLSADGLDYGRWTGQRGYIRWVQVRRVEYAPSMRWFKLHMPSGSPIRISAMLMGLPAFAQHVLAYVPAGRIDNSAKALLIETAEGNLPEVWS